MKPSLFLSVSLPAIVLAAPISDPVSGLTTHIRTLFTSISSSLVSRAAPYATTANELSDGTPCRDVTLIYARGTTQDGNIGAAGDVGPLMMNNLSAIIGADKLAVQGVDYDADVAGFLGNLVGADDDGAKTMADLVTRASTQCPATKIVMSAYSQGGQLAHTAADNLANSAALNQIAAVVIFGDPNNGDPVGTIAADKVKIICHDGDNICDGGVLVLPPHLNYQIDAKTAADFIASKVA
ncbi:hypothetical protein N0V82_003974 [Gnomoniopsis sp. IMI 355080]|nr:hypothetical protein N0V82_003974 [Gnomoniopsis sp. IMI 355080]